MEDEDVSPARTFVLLARDRSVEARRIVKDVFGAVSRWGLLGIPALLFGSIALSYMAFVWLPIWATIPSILFFCWIVAREIRLARAEDLFYQQIALLSHRIVRISVDDRAVHVCDISMMEDSCFAGSCKREDVTVAVFKNADILISLRGVMFLMTESDFSDNAMEIRDVVNLFENLGYTIERQPREKAKSLPGGMVG